MGVVATSFVEPCSLFLRITKNFRNFQRKKREKMRRFLRGSSSRDPKDDGSEKKPKYMVPQVEEVRACEWPSDVFLHAAGIY